MKFIKLPGKPFWVGQKVECAGCKAKAELEVGDPVSSMYDASGIELNSKCPCGGVLYRQIKWKHLPQAGKTEKQREEWSNDQGMVVW